MNTIILSAASIEAIRTYTDVSIEATGAKESAAAALISQGVTVRWGQGRDRVGVL